MKLFFKYILIIVSLSSLVFIETSCTKEIEKIEAPYLIPIQITDDEAQYRFDYDDNFILIKYTKITNGIIEENTIEYDDRGRIAKRHYLLQKNDDQTTKIYTYTYMGNTIYESDEEEHVDTLTVNNYDLMRYSKFSETEDKGYNELLEYENNFKLTKIVSNDFNIQNNIKKLTTETYTFQYDEKRAPYYNLNTPRWFVINKLPYGKYWSLLSVVEIIKETVHKEDGNITDSSSSTIEMSYTYNQVDDPATIVWTEGDVSKTIQIGYKDINGLWYQPAE